MRAIWTTLLVEENNLNQCISALRRVLGEKRAEHRYDCYGSWTGLQVRCTREQAQAIRTCKK